MGRQLVRSGAVRLTDVVVVGGGFWGTFICRSLRALGLSVVCLDALVEGAASRAAAGLVWASAFTPRCEWWGERHTAACASFFSDGWVEERLVSAWSPEGRSRGRVWCGRVELEQAVPFAVRSLPIAEHPSRWIVLAAGVWCDSILEASGLPLTGVAASRGVGLVGPGSVDGVLSRAYRLPGDTRTRVVSMRPWGPGVRLGDTLPEREEEQLLEMARWCPGSTQVWGLRPRLPSLLVEPWGPGLVVATGGYRNGLAVAPGVGLRVAELLVGGVEHGV